jgi:hypothetical protein
MFTLTTLLVRNGYLAEKEEQDSPNGFVQVVCCNFSYTNFNVYIKKIIKGTVTSSSSVKNYTSDEILEITDMS